MLRPKPERELVEPLFALSFPIAVADQHGVGEGLEVADAARCRPDGAAPAMQERDLAIRGVAQDYLVEEIVVLNASAARAVLQAARGAEPDLLADGEDAADRWHAASREMPLAGVAALEPLVRHVRDHATGLRHPPNGFRSEQIPRPQQARQLLESLPAHPLARGLVRRLGLGTVLPPALIGLAIHDQEPILLVAWGGRR